MWLIPKLKQNEIHNKYNQLTSHLKVPLSIKNNKDINVESKVGNVVNIIWWGYI